MTSIIPPRPSSSSTGPSTPDTETSKPTGSSSNSNSNPAEFCSTLSKEFERVIKKQKVTYTTTTSAIDSLMSQLTTFQQKLLLASQLSGANDDNSDNSQTQNKSVEEPDPMTIDSVQSLASSSLSSSLSATSVLQSSLSSSSLSLSSSSLQSSLSSSSLQNSLSPQQGSLNSSLSGSTSSKPPSLLTGGVSSNCQKSVTTINNEFRDYALTLAKFSRVLEKSIPTSFALPPQCYPAQIPPSAATSSVALSSCTSASCSCSCPSCSPKTNSSSEKENRETNTEQENNNQGVKRKTFQNNKNRHNTGGLCKCLLNQVIALYLSRTDDQLALLFSEEASLFINPSTPSSPSSSVDPTQKRGSESEERLRSIFSQHRALAKILEAIERFDLSLATEWVEHNRHLVFDQDDQNSMNIEEQKESNSQESQNNNPNKSNLIKPERITKTEWIELEFSLYKLSFLQILNSSNKENQLNESKDSQANNQTTESHNYVKEREKLITFAKKYFPPFFSTHHKEIQKLMASILFNHRLSASPYSNFSFNSESQNNHHHQLIQKIESLFTKLYSSFYSLSQQSPLYTAVTAGAIAIPTLVKFSSLLKKDPSSSNQSSSSPSISALLSSSFPGDSFSSPMAASITPSSGDGSSASSTITLPIAITDLNNNIEYLFHSIFTCPVSREQTSEQDGNPPMLLTCGHVISKASLSRLARPTSTRFKCPYCPTEQIPTRAQQCFFY